MNLFTIYIISTGYDEVLSPNVKGLVTVSKTLFDINQDADFGMNKKMAVSINLYDPYGRVIQTKTDNHLGGTDIASNDYDFAGTVLRTHLKHTALNKSIILASRNEYDHAGRLFKTFLNTDGKGEVLLNVNQYNSLGQLKTKYQHWTTQKTDYQYNIRGWLTQLNDPNNLGFAYFGMKLSYNEPESVYSTIQPQFNGNISSMVWANKKETGAIHKAAYGFEYDAANRLLNANYLDGTSLTAHAGHYNETLTYDKNGNISKLLRRAANAVIDSLNYTYIGNRLIMVKDTVGNKAFGDFASKNAAYQYDLNGNMTEDNGKTLTFTYNALNLPYVTGKTAAQEKLKFMYNTAGQKLRTVEYNDVSAIVGTTDYADAFVYKNGILDYIIMPEGRILVTDNGTTRTYAYEYHVKDHLGNTRATYTAGTNGASTLTQYAAYYPFGLAIDGLSWQLVNKNDPDKNPYLYNGKELHTQLNLNLHDYGARYYDAAVGRFHTIDPLAEKYNFQSPYVYAANNPIRFIDWMGMAAGDPPYGIPAFSSFVNSVSSTYNNIKSASNEALSGTLNYATKSLGIAGKDYSKYSLQEGNISGGANVKIGPFSGSMKVVIAFGKSEAGGYDGAARFELTGSNDLRKDISLKSWKDISKNTKEVFSASEGTGVTAIAGVQIKFGDSATIKTEAGTSTSTYSKTAATILGNGGEIKSSLSSTGTLSIGANISLGGKIARPWETTFGTEAVFRGASKSMDR